MDIDELYWSLSPTPASRRWKSADALVRSGAMDIIVIDSVAALVPKAEIDGDMGDATSACRRA